MSIWRPLIVWLLFLLSYQREKWRGIWVVFTMNCIKWRISLSCIRYLFIFFLTESFVKLFIRTKSLKIETKEVIEEDLTKAAQKYLKLNDHSGDNCAQAMKSFTDHLIKFYNLLLVTLGVGGMGIFCSRYLILRRSHWSMFSMVCQQYRMRAKSNNRKIVTMVRMFILWSEVLSAVAVVAA